MNRDWMHRLVGTLAISFALSQVAWGQGVFDDDPGANVNDFPEFNDQGTQPSAEQAQQIAEQVQNLNNDARSLVQQGNVEAAILKYEEALAVENSPGNFESHFERGKLLREQGYQVEGLFMKNWEEDDGTEYCTAKEDLADAQAVAGLSAALHDRLSGSCGR